MRNIVLQQREAFRVDECQGRPTIHRVFQRNGPSPVLGVSDPYSGIAWPFPRNVTPSTSTRIAPPPVFSASTLYSPDSRRFRNTSLRIEVPHVRDVKVTSGSLGIFDGFDIENRARLNRRKLAAVRPVWWQENNSPPWFKHRPMVCEEVFGDLQRWRRVLAPPDPGSRVSFEFQWHGELLGSNIATSVRNR